MKNVRMWCAARTTRQRHCRVHVELTETNMSFEMNYDELTIHYIIIITINIKCARIELSVFSTFDFIHDKKKNNNNNLFNFY